MTPQARRTVVVGLFGFAVGVVGGCRVNLDDTLVYSCTQTADCGGDGFVCAAPPGGAGRCCKPNGDEVCNGADDDCDGQVDEGFPVERCNMVDDDCDGETDEGFDLKNDRFNCGTCGTVCLAEQNCENGGCRTRGEIDCGDDVDNDDSGTKDCEEPACNLQSCGTGCQCRAGKKAEGNCTNAADDDDDLKTDCADEDCGGAGCGDGGCTCSGGKKTETACNDTIDNDGDTGADCADTDCGGRICSAAPNTLRCKGTMCVCNDGGTVAETTPALCRNGIDDDCNGLTDCQEAACDQRSCQTDGGTGCVCVAGERIEQNCADRIDNDNDGFTDCQDALADGGGNCKTGVACSFISGGNPRSGFCAPSRLCTADGG